MNLHALMFGWEYPPRHLGGLGVACQGMVRGLLKNNVKVTLVLPNSDVELDDGMESLSPTEDLMNTIHVRSFLHPYEGTDQFEKRMSALPKELQDIYGADLPQAVMHFAEMSVDMTKDVRPDVVHCHDWMTYDAARLSSAYHSKPMVAHIHATELDRTNFSPNEWIFDVERRGFEAADRIIAVSSYTRNILVKHYGISPDKIMVVHNGQTEQHSVPLLRSQYMTREHPMVLFLGRLTIQKGPIQFLDMAKKIHDIRPDVQYVMAGDGNMIGEVMHHACEIGLEHNVVFAGKVSTPEAKHLYAHADCFVMPSLSEPFGLVALEAISHGTPVVVSKQSGVSEVVAHGFSVDFWDTDKMADCVLTVLRDKPLAMQLRSQSQLALTDLTWHRQAGHIRSIYENVITA